jgi:hypothetical protein
MNNMEIFLYQVYIQPQDLKCKHETWSHGREGDIGISGDYLAVQNLIQPQLYIRLATLY